MNNRNIKFYIIGSLLVISLLFTSIEIATRLISWISGNGFFIALYEKDANDPAITGIYQWHPFTGITIKPNTVFHAGHPRQKTKSEIHVDKFGFLSKDNNLSIDKPANEIRIATIGASTTASLNLSYDENWPGYLGDLLEKKYPDKKIRIINAGVPGFDTAQSIGNLALRVMPFHPDVVIIYHAYNDLKAVIKGKKFRPDYSHIHNTPFGFRPPPNLFQRILNCSMFYIKIRDGVREYKSHLTSIQNKKNREILDHRLTQVPNEAVETFDQHIRELVAIARSGGAKVILSSFATLLDPKSDYGNPKTLATMSLVKQQELRGILHFTPGLTLSGTLDGINRYNHILHTISTEEKTGWTDNANLIPHDERFFVDRVHFNKEGAKLMAQNLLPSVMQALDLPNE